MTRRSGISYRVPWTDPSEITIPVYMAYCAIAAALRPWNRNGAGFNVVLCPQEDYDFEVFQTAGRIFVGRLGDEDRPWVYELSKRWQREQGLVSERERVVYFKPVGYKASDEEKLSADAILDVPIRTRRHAEAALRRFNVPLDNRYVDLLLTESWTRLEKAFQSRRSPLIAFDRLQRVSATSASADTPAPDAAGPKLSELHGLGPAVAWGTELTTDLADYKAGNIAWDRVDSGALLSGPPGTGKTLFARALAKTCDVPIVYGSFASWQEKGSMDALLQEMRKAFDDAASKAPSILFLDELDAFGDRNTGDHHQSYMTGVITGLLQLLDGFERRVGVVVLGACNYPDRVDPAIRRAGRLNRHLEIPLPDGEARRSIVRYYSGVELDAEQAIVFDLATEGFAGADIKLLVNDAERTARRQRVNLAASHIMEHLRPVVALPEEHIYATAVHEAGHALVAAELKFGELVKVSVTTHGVFDGQSPLGYTRYAFPSVRRRTRSEFLDEIAVLLGGVAAETEVFDSFDCGAAGPEAADLSIVTRLATILESGLGMGHTLAVEDCRPRRLEQLRDSNPELRKRIHDVIEQQFERSRSIVRRQRTVLDQLVEKLMLTKELSGEEVTDIVQRHRTSWVSLAKMPRRAGM
ncbi:AAA family ATPase [Ensifer adhaerens]|uniref:AAA family ATPase n=1 Tax=Ensifer adhaerens TaxID=106592 RepID=UPI001FEFCA07|nr:AAA family ATPase [Ensifer adhaerens]